MFKKFCTALRIVITLNRDKCFEKKTNSVGSWINTARS